MKCSGVTSITARMPPLAPRPSMLGGGEMMRAFIMISTLGPGSSSSSVPSRFMITPPSIVPMSMPRPKAQRSMRGSHRRICETGLTSRCGWPPAASSQASAGTPVPAPMAALRW